jgi:hypothetical protein
MFCYSIELFGPDGYSVVAILLDEGKAVAFANNLLPLYFDRVVIHKSPITQDASAIKTSKNGDILFMKRERIYEEQGTKRLTEAQVNGYMSRFI